MFVYVGLVVVRCNVFKRTLKFGFFEKIFVCVVLNLNKSQKFKKDSQQNPSKPCQNGAVSSTSNVC